MKQKIIIPVMIIAVIILSISLWQQVGPGPDPRLKTSGLPMKVGVNFWPGQYWMSIAHENGWFRQAGLNVEIVLSDPDYFASLKAMVDGKLDSNNFSLFDLIVFNLGGADLVMVAAADDSAGVDAIVVKSDIKTIYGLKGKRVGVSRNTYLEYILSVVLKRNNLSMDDVELIDLPGEKMAEEFIRGNLDAVVTWGAHIRQSIEKGQGTKIFDTSDIPGLSPAGIVFHRSFIEKRFDDVQAYVEVWHKTIRFIHEKPEEAFAIIAKAFNRPLEDVRLMAKIDKILDFKANQIAFTYAAGIDSLYGSFHQMNEFMIRNQMAKKKLDSSQWIDDRFIQALKWSIK